MARQAIVPRTQYEYPTDVQAEAVGLALASGYSEAAREMARRHPDRSPSRDLIWRWARKLEPERFNELQREQQEAVTERIMDLALLAADKLEEEIRAGNIKAQQLAVTWGINVDKTLRLREIEARREAPRDRRNVGMFVIVQGTRPQEPEGEVIEGEVSDA
jgi:hypothetical protein